MLYAHGKLHQFDRENEKHLNYFSQTENPIVRDTIRKISVLLYTQKRSDRKASPTKADYDELELRMGK